MVQLRLRWRLRTLLAALAVAATATWALLMWRRSEQYRGAAEVYAAHERVLRSDLKQLGEDVFDSGWVLEREGGQLRWKRMTPAAARAHHRAELARGAAEYGRLRRGFERAARYPWLTVPLDPPPPD